MIIGTTEKVLLRGRLIQRSATETDMMIDRETIDREIERGPPGTTEVTQQQGETTIEGRRVIIEMMVGRGDIVHHQGEGGREVAAERERSVVPDPGQLQVVTESG